MKLNLKHNLIGISIFVSLFSIVEVRGERIYATKVFVYPIKPALFNWTVTVEDFSYRPTLLNAPDLPKWIEYLFSKKHKTGFLFGVPPKEVDELEIVSTSFLNKISVQRNIKWVQVVSKKLQIIVLFNSFAAKPKLHEVILTAKVIIEIIGQNTKTYETRRKVIHLNISNISHPATHEVHLKIDNLNVEDFFDLHQMTRLLKIFKYKLWKNSSSNLYFTYLISAVSLGARRPLRPTEGEGVVIRLGSTAEFSTTLIELQEEVKPLGKLQSCPRDFKRTTVERVFREEGFILDWCNFKLIDTSENFKKNFGSNDKRYFEPEFLSEPIWLRPTKDEIICRSYNNEFALIIVVPVLIMIFLVILLSAILGIQMEGMKNESDEFFESIFHICEEHYRRKKESVTSQIFAPQFSSYPPQSNSMFYADISKLNEPFRFRTIAHHDSRTISTNGVSRPTPPPYNGSLKKTVIDF